MFVSACKTTDNARNAGQNLFQNLDLPCSLMYGENKTITCEPVIKSPTWPTKMGLLHCDFII